MVKFAFKREGERTHPNMHLLQSLCFPLDQSRSKCVLRKTHLLQAHWVAGSKCVLRKRRKCILRSGYLAIHVSRISDSRASSQPNVRNVQMAWCFQVFFAKRICFHRPNAAHGDTLLAPCEVLFGKCICFRQYILAHISKEASAFSETSV